VNIIIKLGSSQPEGKGGLAQLAEKDYSFPPSKKRDRPDTHHPTCQQISCSRKGSQFYPRIDAPVQATADTTVRTTLLAPVLAVPLLNHIPMARYKQCS
jgi:hypothetical protein